MRKLLFWGSASLLSATALLLACEDSTSEPPPVVIDAGTNIDASTPDTFVPPQQDAAPEDSGSDTGAGDAGADAAPPLNALFGHINQKLVSINPTTGAIADIGTTNQNFMVLAWDDTAKVARVILNGYSPIGGASTPTLGTINLCTGAVTVGPAITVNGTQVRRSEALAQDPTTGTWYISVGTINPNSTASEFLTEATGTVNIATGAVVINGNHQTFQDDGDCATFIGPTLKLLDVASNNNTGGFYTIDKTNGASSALITTGASVLRIGYDASRSTMFALIGSGTAPNTSNRGLASINLTTGASTPIGTPLAAGTYNNELPNAFLVAPPPVCQ